MSKQNVSIADKQYLAKILYTREHLDAKVVARRVGVTEKTMSSWVNQFNWKALRNRMLVSKETILSDLYGELEELSEAIKQKPQGERYSDSKQADIKVKLTASIRNMETELAIADLVEAGIRFGKYLQANAPHEQMLDFMELWNSFILENIRK